MNKRMTVAVLSVALLAGAALFSLAAAQQKGVAKPPLRVYISVDMEGIKCGRTGYPDRTAIKVQANANPL